MKGDPRRDRDPAERRYGIQLMASMKGDPRRDRDLATTGEPSGRVILPQ